MALYSRCLFCGADDLKSSWMRSTHFNKKTFIYKECKSCNLIIVEPLPDEQDLLEMYPPSYQQGIDDTIYKSKLPGLRFSYDFQFALIKKFSPGTAKILDYGCGNANFVINALDRNFNCEGAEFNADHVKILKDAVRNTSFFTINELDLVDQKYDVIRLSNVLEHLINPAEIMQFLKSKLKDGGIFLIEGPIENNSGLAYVIRRFHTKIKNLFIPGKSENHPVTHIFFSNQRNQLDFFEKMGLETVFYKVTENAWPYPEYWSQCKSAGQVLKYLIAKISIFVSTFIPRWGNTFIYAGRKK